MVKMHLSNKSKIYVINDADPVNAICPTCGFFAREKSDLTSIEKESACKECTLNFKYLDIDAWKEGCRPTKKAARLKMLINVGDI
jgi:hypothetical protein